MPSTARTNVRNQLNNSNDPYACPHCGSQGAYMGWSQTGPDSWVESYRCQGDCGRDYEVHWHNDTYPYKWNDDTEQLFDTDNLSTRRIGRLNKCLDRRYRFDSGTMSLHQWLQSQELTHKTQHTREYALYKRNGCHKKLKEPKTHYSVYVGESGIEIPKIVWDALNLPEKETE